MHADRSGDTAPVSGKPAAGGLPSGIGAAVLESVKARKLRWLFAFFASHASPIIEVAFISCLYLVIDPGKRSELLDRLGQLPFGSAPATWSSWTQVAVFCTLGLTLLTVSIALRYANEINLVNLVYESYLDDSRRLVQGYFFTDALTASRISRERMTSSILLDCGVLAQLARQILIITGALFTLMAYLCCAAYLSWQLLLVSLLVYGVPLLLSRRLYDSMKEVGRLKMSGQEALLSHFADVLGGFERTRLDGLESALGRKSDTVLAVSQAWRIKKRRAQAWLHVTMDGLPLLGLLVILFVGTTFLGVSLAVLTTLFVVFNRIKAYVSVASDAYLSLREYLPNAGRFLTLLSDIGPPRTFAADPDAPVRGFREISVHDVSFSYGEEPVLEHVDFGARAGDRILVQGPSGQGKSTFLEVLCGLLPPKSGQVLYDGRLLDEKSFYEVRPGIAYASPTVYLFRDTLRNNLLMGHPGREPRLNEAIRHACLEDVIGTLPQGLDSTVGTNGDALSLGQRQRVILARLYLGNPRLILLDEATANVDPALEARLMQNLLAFMDPQAILVVVAHKAPGGIRFNKRFVMERGRLSEVAVVDDAAAISSAGNAG